MRNLKSSPVGTGAELLRVQLEILLVGLGLGAFLRFCLYLRPNPYGGGFVTDLWHYLPYALFYGLWGMLLLVLPAFAVCGLFFRRALSARLTAGLHHSSVVLLAFALFADQFDNEVMRFMGVHPNPVFFETYRHVGASKDMCINLSRNDAGGPWVSFVLLLLVPLMMLLWGRVSWWRLRNVPSKPWPIWAMSLGLGVALIVPTVAYFTPGGKFRLARVQPLWMTLATSSWSTNVGVAPKNLSQLILGYQDSWQEGTTDTRYRFNSPKLPYVREPKNPTSKAAKQLRSIIVVQVESLRGLDVGFLDPRKRPSVTPFLDSLAANGRAFTRALSFGPPTVNAFIGAHCSVSPHREVNISVQLVRTKLFCYPDALRTLGYHTVLFTGNDPDWDGQRAWLDRWYNEHHYYPEAKEDDRVTLALATQRVLEIGRRGGPFLATVVTATNHAPFNSRDPKLDVNGHATAQERVRNTVHFTDVALGQFFDGLRGEPWFKDTLIVVYGDHGYNLGEHPKSPAGARNGYVESTWVPLIFSGNIGWMARGLDDSPVSLLDLAPTVAELAGYDGATPWTGASLLWPVGANRLIAFERGGLRFGSTTGFNLVHDAASNRVQVFAAQDLLETMDLAASERTLVERFNAQSRANSVLNDYLLESNQVWSAAR